MKAPRKLVRCATKAHACGCKGEPCYPAAKHPERCKLFYCVGCRLYQPWCFGVADDLPALCDDCAAVAHRRAS